MALQIEVTVADIAPDGSGGTITLNMKCWKQGDDTKTDTPVIDISKSAYVKKGVEGKSLQQLINAALLRIAPLFQAEIKAYKQKAVIYPMINTTAVKNALEG